MPTSLITDIFRMTENHDVTIGFSYSQEWHSFKIEIRRGDLLHARYFNARDVWNETFIVDLVRLMINEIDRKEKELKEKEKKDE